MSEELVLTIEQWLHGIAVPYAGTDLETGMILVWNDEGYIVPANGSLQGQQLVGIAKRNIQRGEAIVFSCDERSDVAIHGVYKVAPAPYYFGYIKP